MAKIPTNNSTSFLAKMTRKYIDVEDQRSPILNLCINVAMSNLRYNPDDYNSLYLTSPLCSMTVNVPPNGQSNVNTSTKIEKVLLHGITKKPYKGINIIKHPRFEINLENQSIHLLRLLIDYILNGDLHTTLDWVKPIQDILIEKELIRSKRAKKTRNNTSINEFSKDNIIPKGFFKERAKLEITEEGNTKLQNDIAIRNIIGDINYKDNIILRKKQSAQPQANWFDETERPIKSKIEESYRAAIDAYVLDKEVAFFDETMLKGSTTSKVSITSFTLDPLDPLKPY